MDPLEPEEALAVFEAADVAHLAVISEDEPYVTPISFVMIDGGLRFRTAPGRRLRAIMDGARVCIEAFRMRNGGAWDSVIAWGGGRAVTEDAAVQETVSAFYDKYREALGDPFSITGLPPSMGMTQIVTVDFDTVTGMCSGKGFSPRIRPGRL